MFNDYSIQNIPGNATCYIYASMGDYPQASLFLASLNPERFGTSVCGNEQCKHRQNK